MSTQQRIKDIEDEVGQCTVATKCAQLHFSHLLPPPPQMAKTQKNKATAKHLGLLKARLAKARRELLEPKVRRASVSCADHSRLFSGWRRRQHGRV
jgi:hypothetical protein